MAITSNTHREITICDPGRWGLNFTEKRKWNYQLRLDFFADPDINQLNNDEKMVFLGIILQSLRENKVIVRFCLEHFKVSLRLSLSESKVCLNTLESLDIIGLQTKVRSSKRKEYKQTNKQTNKENETDLLVSEKTDFNFDTIYALYPRKSGKTKGIEKCNTQIKTLKDFNLLLIAVKNYATECQINETEKKYIKLFSTFMGCWRDYLDIEIPINPFDLFDDINPNDQPIIKRISE